MSKTYAVLSRLRRHEQAGKERLSVCVEGADLVIERMGLAQRIRIQLDQVEVLKN